MTRRISKTKLRHGTFTIEDKGEKKEGTIVPARVRIIEETTDVKTILTNKDDKITTARTENSKIRDGDVALGSRALTPLITLKAGWDKRGNYSPMKENFFPKRKAS